MYQGCESAAVAVGSTLTNGHLLSLSLFQLSYKIKCIKAPPKDMVCFFREDQSMVDKSLIIRAGTFSVTPKYSRAFKETIVFQILLFCFRVLFLFCSFTHVTGFKASEVCWDVIHLP